MEEEIKIVFEDNDLMVLEKPAGWVTTKENNKNQKTLEEWISKNRPNGLLREGIVHRLDKGTSGLVLVAKNQEALENLKKQFKQRTVQKEYLALAGGNVSCEGQINMPIARSKFGFGKFGVGVDGKPSLTLFKVIGKYCYQGKFYSLLRIELKTGRTHQIRVHLSYLHWPLVGDKLYGGEGTLDRPFLHSAKIGFDHPITKEMMVFESELPDELKSFLTGYEKK